MNPFSHLNYKNDQLQCEETPLSELVRQYGTPLYVYSHAALKDRFERFTGAFNGVDLLVCYSMKANSNAAVLKTFLKAGSGIDVVTGGELHRALKAGCDPKKIVYSGVGKQDDEIQMALEAGILQFNVESEAELEAIQKVAKRLNKKAPIAFRVNPDVDPKTHAYIATGLKKSKFGISHDRVLEVYRHAASLSNIEIVGMDCHIGSQLTTVAPFIEAAKRVRALVDKLSEAGIQIRNLDMGGGVGIVYKDETPPDLKDYAEAFKAEFKGLNLKLILEPGRFMVGNAGLVLTKVIYNKPGEVKHFVIVDAASNDLMRPSLYGAYHAIWPVKRDEARAKKTVDLVGPICETGDFLALDRELQAVEEGEYLALLSAGAYGFSMSSTYNSRPRAAEVMVKGSQHAVIRERESLEDLVKGEKTPDFL